VSFLLERYFDNAATTPIDPLVRAEMEPFLGEAFGNAHSIHAWGSRARSAVERARAQIAKAANALPEQILFTASATEANNWILSDYDEGAISRFEHSAVRIPALRKGFPEIDLSFLPGTEEPHVSGLLSVIHVNNETGIVLPWDTAGPHETHRDASQSLGKLDMSSVSSAYLTLSSHKAYGPKGAGCLVCFGPPPKPYILGGEQEYGLRAGTLNVPAIVGFGLAAEIAEERQAEDWVHAKQLRTVFLDELRGLDDWQVNEETWHPEGLTLQVPHILSLSFGGIEGESLVIDADSAGFAISSGAACSSASTEPSHVLKALGVPNDRIRGSVRISFGRYTPVDSTVALARVLSRSVKSLRSAK
jgi:cysteine desulfurase